MSFGYDLIFDGKSEEKLSEIIYQLKKDIQNLDISNGDDSWSVEPYELIQTDLEYTRNRHRYDYVQSSIAFYEEYDLVESMGYKEYWKKNVVWEFPDDSFFEQLTKKYNRRLLEMGKRELIKEDGWWKHQISRDKTGQHKLLTLYIYIMILYDE